jgi:hypothetical protein
MKCCCMEGCSRIRSVRVWSFEPAAPFSPFYLGLSTQVDLHVPRHPALDLHQPVQPFATLPQFLQILILHTKEQLAV